MRHVHGAQVSLGDRVRQRNNELIGLLRGDIDAIFLKGAHGLHLADEFGLRVVVDIGSHPDPLVRANIGTPRTLTVDQHLLDQHFDAAMLILDSVLRAEQWAWAHPEETRRFLARELNTSEYWVAAAYGEDAHLRLRTNLAERSIEALQDLTDFLERWGSLRAASMCVSGSNPGRWRTCWRTSMSPSRPHGFIASFMFLATFSGATIGMAKIVTTLYAMHLGASPLQLG